MATLSRHLGAEALGTALLLAIVIGSGVMAERLSSGHVAVALLANTAATVGGLYVLIEVFGPVSGAHFNPAVSAVMAWRGALPVAWLLPCVLAQLVGAVAGAWLAEAVATAGLLLVVLRAGPGKASASVPGFIAAQCAGAVLGVALDRLLGRPLSGSPPP